MFTYLIQFKRGVIFSITIMMAMVLLLATIELGWILLQDILSPPFFLLEVNELLELFGLFMLVIIGVELLETIIKTYLAEKPVNHVEVVIAVAIIAITRKVIILDVKDVSSLSLIGIGAIVLALSLGYYLVRHKTAGE
ncbi:MAG: phosphate-starvation-inducible PsiE family protein [Thermodesulfobacteriota bacterium]